MTPFTRAVAFDFEHELRWLKKQFAEHVRPSLTRHASAASKGQKRRAKQVKARKKLARAQARAAAQETLRASGGRDRPPRR